MAALAVPAAATTAALAYLNARWRLSVDYKLLSSRAKASYQFRKRQTAGRLNSFCLLEEHALNKQTADKIFLMFEDQQWTFAKFYDLVLRYAGWLHATYAISPGEIVAVDFMNSPQFLLLTVAIWSLGATPALVNYNLTGDPLIHSVKVSGARVFIIDPEVASTALTAKTRDAFASPTFRNGVFPMTVIIFDRELESSVNYFPPYRAPDTTRTSTEDRQLAVLISTSGTTGLPKAAVMPWDRLYVPSLFLSGLLDLQNVRCRNPDRFYTPMPLYHASAFLGFHICVTNAVTLVLGRQFSVSKFWPEVRTHDATVIQYVGETLRYLVNAPVQAGERTNHNVRLAFGNGLRPDVWKKFKARFGVETIAEFYGATEGMGASFNLNNNDFSDGAIGQWGKIGEILVSRAQAIVRVDWELEQPWRHPVTSLCERVPRGTPGELLFKLNKDDAATTFRGYHGNPEAGKAKVLHDVLVKGDAYYRTGDVVRRDVENRFWFLDRIGDTFRWKSENVSTAEVSEVLGYHSDILSANVYGVEVPGHEGRAGCAAVVLKDSALTSDGGVKKVKHEVLESLATYARNSFPRFSVPVFLRVTKEMTLTGNHKPQKNMLRNQGVDLHAISKAGSGDLIYWLEPGSESYAEFRAEDLHALGAGKAKL